MYLVTNSVYSHTKSEHTTHIYIYIYTHTDTLTHTNAIMLNCIIPCQIMLILN